LYLLFVRILTIFAIMKNGLLLLFTFVFIQAHAQTLKSYIADPNSGPREHNVDILHMKVELSFDPPKGKVMGTVTHIYTPLRNAVDTIFWDAPGIDIRKVSMKAGKTLTPVKFRIIPAGVVTYFDVPLSWDNKYELVMDYEAYPRKGLYFIGWNSPANTDNRNQTRRQIWTQGQGIDNRYWIPMYDQGNDKFVTETLVKFENKYKVLSNGKSMGCIDNKDGTCTWHYLMPAPHAGYLLMLAIDEYEVKKTKTSRGTPVQFWYYPEHPEKVEWTSMHTEKIIEFLEDETGTPYMWGAYSQVMVQDFLYGAMENTSATIFGDFFNVDSRSFLDRNYIGVNAHELTHQWFGDYTTARAAEGTWLQESFATYYAKIFTRFQDGEDEYKWNHRGEVQSALSAGAKDNLPIVHSGSGTARVYQKGSTVIQMMRYVLGDDAFKRMIKYYLKEHAFANVESRDMEQAIQDVLGINMDWFFDQWLYRGGEPHYKISWDDLGDKVKVNVRQIQEMNATIGLFKMPVNVDVYFADGTKMSKKEWIEDIYQEVVFSNPDKKKVSFVLFDVNHEITKKLTFERSFSELSNQLNGAVNMIDRHEALLALSSYSADQKRDLLQQAFLREKFWGMKAEIVKQLCADEKSWAFLLQQVNEKSDHRVRRALLSNIKGIPSTFTEFYTKSLQDSSYTNVEIALDRLMEINPGNNRALYLDPLKEVLGHSNSIRLKWLENALNHQVYPGKESQFADQLIDYTSNKYEFRTRIAAMTAVKKTGLFNETLITNLMNAAAGTNRRLGGPAIDLVKYLSEDYRQAQIIRKIWMTQSADTQKWLKEAGLSY